MKEIWKDIEGYEGLYQVSNLGNVKRLRHGDYKCVQGYRVFPERLKILSFDKKGYLQVGLSKNNKQTMRRVHRLVAEAFIPNPNEYPMINHKDENKANNNVNNLEWCDARYNVIYSLNRKRTGKGDTDAVN